MRKFSIDKDYKGIGCDIYKKKTISINPGVTVLVGCNGIGKTTLIQQMVCELERKNIPSISFDNLKNGGSAARSEAIFYGDMNFLGASLQSSEGENIFLNVGKFASKIGNFVKSNQHANEIWIFVDAIDSGLSVDNIVDVKNDLFKLIIETNSNKDVYIVVSANEYELARNENCFDVYNGKYVHFKDYEDYRNFILSSRKEKNNRAYKDEEEQ